MKKRKILFLGESYRADAITWTTGLKEFGDFEIIGWELKTPSDGFFNRILRILEFCFALSSVRKIIQTQQPDMVIAERTTSYGFLAALCGVKPIAIAQQGRTDLWPEHSLLLPLKRIAQNYAFRKASLIHAWGKVMTISMIEADVDMSKVLVLSKGINLDTFSFCEEKDNTKIKAIVTRSLLPEYGHKVILKAFQILDQKKIDFQLTIVGDGNQLDNLKILAKELKIDAKVIFTGRLQNTALPQLLHQSNFYISMPITEGVSGSLFEAMACGLYPIVTDVPGNASWIKHRENGQLVTIDDYQMLADALEWATKNLGKIKIAIQENRQFVEKNANYKINMKVIADRYHELIKSTKK